MEKRPMTAKARINGFVQSVANRLGYEIRRVPAAGERPEKLAAELKLQQSEDKQYRRSNGQLLTPEIVRTLVESHKDWSHTIMLPFGIKTPGLTYGDDIENWTAQVIPMELTGLSVLDVGAWDGYYSFLCEKRGAKVTAIDSLMHGFGTRGFDICKDILDSKVRFIKLDVYDVESLKERFDIVLYFGVYYHLQDPLLAFKRLHNITNLSLLVEGHFVEYADEKPLAFFYPGVELKGDSSNWWGPNEQCLLGMIKSAGFKRVTTIAKIFGDTVYGARVGRIIVKADV